MLVGLRFRWLLAAILLAFVAVFVACSGSGSSTGIPPTTGIVIRAETLTTGRGCGRGATQLFKYAAVVYGYNGNPPEDDLSRYDQPITAGVYDCFADGTFVELSASNDSFTFRLEVYAYNEQAYLASRDAIEGAGTNAGALRAAGPTWSTICTATQQRDVQTLAVCEPLVSGLLPTSVVLRTGAFSRAGGGTATCAAPGSSDAGTDAGDAGDAGDDAASDAGVDAGDPIVDGGTSGLTFSTVRVTARSNGAPVAPETSISCPETFVVSDATPGASYELDVTLLDELSAPVGTTKCTARAVAGAETTAVCDPVQ